ncbi:hypothetical protein PC9H_011238 [Pleurotus ostreatus]|uniref:Uncharacterized protein n=1 Tax=Pleurotus ostreatus TaxID=5322 RepID=A0A8H6ZL34_PLEOS|nr:uncharacterized protein PC9H_011238 [Pleurotus ostreatus]KAF7420720.1 hypothetical protein PC9H_011238 [Pleurotus ostreatus]
MFDRSSTNFLMKIATDGGEHNYAANFDASSDYIAASGSRASLGSGSSEDNGYGGMAESEDEDGQGDGGRRVLKVRI